MNYLSTDRLKVQDLTEDEKNKLLEALLDHIGREVEVTRFSDWPSRVTLVKPERW